MQIVTMSYRTPHYAFDTIYFSTAAGRKFLHYCDFVHKFSDDVIMQRRKELLQVFSIISGYNILYQYFCRKHNQLESTRIFWTSYYLSGYVAINAVYMAGNFQGIKVSVLVDLFYP